MGTLTKCLHDNSDGTVGEVCTPWETDGAVAALGTLDNIRNTIGHVQLSTDALLSIDHLGSVVLDLLPLRRSYGGQFNLLRVRPLGRLTSGVTSYRASESRRIRSVCHVHWSIGHIKDPTAPYTRKVNVSMSYHGLSCTVPKRWIATSRIFRYMLGRRNPAMSVPAGNPRYRPRQGGSKEMCRRLTNREKFKHRELA
jgi:hypothetical protein